MANYNLVGEMMDRAEVCEQIGDFVAAEMFIFRAMSMNEESDFETHIQLTRRLVEHYNFLGNYEKAEKALLRLLKELRNENEEDDRIIASMLVELAIFYRENGKWRKSMIRFNQAIALQEPEFGKTYSDFAVTLSEKAHLLALTNRVPQAQKLLENALELAEKKVGKWDESVALVLRRHAAALSPWMTPQQLEPCLERAIAILSEEGVTPHPELRRCLSELADLTLQRGLERKAERLYVRSLQLTESYLGSKHADSVLLLEKIARLRKRLKKFDEAKAVYKKLLEIKQQTHSTNHEIASTLYQLGSVLREGREYEEAETILQKALKMQETNPEEADVEIASTLFELGTLHKSIGSLAEAEDEFERALRIHAESDQDAPLDVADNLSGLASIYSAKKLHAPAKELLQRALNLKEEVLGPADPTLIELLTRLGEVCDSMRKRSAALKYYDRASEIRDKIPEKSSKKSKPIQKKSTTKKKDRS